MEMSTKSENHKNNSNTDYVKIVKSVSVGAYTKSVYD